MGRGSRRERDRGGVCGSRVDAHSFVVAPRGGAFSYDADAGFGFCEDIFGAQGVEGAVGSAVEVARHVRSSSPVSSLPTIANACMIRYPLVGNNHDINCISGSCTYRNEPPS
mmetsp:Transcript_12302/g.14982  ORF Transcript_12302/g.14982 Transcript_12302/m.14982 type:complete len:112 (+) Transcript_12302:197-532(+)